MKFLRVFKNIKKILKLSIFPCYHFLTQTLNKVEERDGKTERRSKQVVLTDCRLININSTSDALIKKNTRLTTFTLQQTEKQREKEYMRVCVWNNSLKHTQYQRCEQSEHRRCTANNKKLCMCVSKTEFNSIFFVICHSFSITVFVCDSCVDNGLWGQICVCVCGVYRAINWTAIEMHRRSPLWAPTRL